MRNCFLSVGLLTVGLAPRAGLGADVQTLVDRVALNDASAEFHFPVVPAPSATDAATSARFSLIAGREDPNSDGLEALNDGQLPLDRDQPSRNFFFNAGTRGGRILVALSDPTDILQVNTYSWHADVRAPQVYRIYGDGGDIELPVPRRRQNLAESGWSLLAAIDTRQPDKAPGGQVGVSISGPNGTSLGRHVRLIFELQPTEENDPWGQTFFSEIDVVDGREHQAVPRVRDLVETTIQDRYTIMFETTDAPELKPWVETRLIPVCREWYPKIVEMFPSEGFSAPTRFTISFEPDLDGVAYCRGKEIHCGARWFAQNLDTEALGAVVHEMVHVVQQYRSPRDGAECPGWLVEGLADYVRWCLYEPPELRPRPDPQRAKYTDSYRTTGAFLAWVVDRHGADVVKTLNTALREGRFTSEMWMQTTGKSVDELWESYIATLAR